MPSPAESGKPPSSALPKSNLIERFAVRFLRNRNERRQPRISRWDAADLGAIRAIERHTVLLAILSGMISGTLIGGMEIGLDRLFAARGDVWSQWFAYWGVFLAGSLTVSGVEIAYLYWIVLHRVARISAVAGLRLSDQDVEQVMALGLSRAALDMPEPREAVYGLDPLTRVPRWRLIVAAVLYRIKIGATSFVIRVVLRRLIARAALRAVIPLIAILVYAIWNAAIIGWVMRAARIRVGGPVAIQELGDRVAAARPNLDEAARALLLHAVGEAVMCSARHHPNFLLLLSRLFAELGVLTESLQLDWASHRQRVAALGEAERELLLACVTGATLLDGRPNRAQRRLLRDVYVLCGREYSQSQIDALYREFFRGQGIGMLGAVGRENAPADVRVA